ncbi:MAG: 4-hydroxy-tetrahydrodipicolinate reductase [Bacteroidetes bacterium 47-18]|nr:MAG: 4-hydroxy-tetrahydrodipicolinate reductase [Bacteroidetes bacterium 47-18]
MKIAIIGYGKMGKKIEEIAVQRGHEVILKINSQNVDEFQADNFKQVDVAIEFTNPHAAFINVMDMLDMGIPVVCGSTGWQEKMPEARKKCLEKNTSFIWASNFSIGVNLFWEINKRMAQIMAPHMDYSVAIEETHHIHKKDAPSGTAITTAEQILELNPSLNSWKLGDDVELNQMPVIAHRVEDVPGTHIVKYRSAIDEIALSHTAFSRDGFALGAILAAEYIQQKKGVYEMKDILGLNV